MGGDRACGQAAPTVNALQGPSDPYRAHIWKLRLLPRRRFLWSVMSGSAGPSNLRTSSKCSFSQTFRTPRATVFSYSDLRLHKTFECERRVPTNPIKQALAMTQLLEAPEIRSKADIAKRLGISRARVTQTINLLKLAPEIRKHVLSLSDEEASFFTERRLRPLTQASSRETQLEAFHELA